ncbi:MAG: O-antigen ligase family protein [Pseudomonadota bacterium]
MARSPTLADVKTPAADRWWQVALACVVAVPVVLVFWRQAPTVLAGVAGLAVLMVALSLPSRRLMVASIRSMVSSPLGIVVIVALAYMALSANWSLAPDRAMGHWWDVLLISLLVLGMVAVVRQHRPDPSPLWLPVAMALAAVLVLINVASGSALNGALGFGTEIFRLNRAAVALVLFAPLAVALLARAKGRNLGFGLLALLGVAVFAADSQSAKLALVCMLLAAPAALYAPRTSHRVIGLLAILALLVTPLVVGFANELVPSAVHAHVGYSTLTVRGEMWREFAAFVWQRPWFGYGLESTAVIVDTPLAAGLSTHGRQVIGLLHPHNAPLQVWVELGAIGALLWAAGVFLAFRAMETLGARDLPIATLTATGVFVVACVSHGAWQDWWWSLVGLVVFAFAMIFASRPSGQR